METPLTLLYTANLRGQIDLLPRLYAFIRQLRAQRVEEVNEVMLCALDPPQRLTLLLDLGENCAPEVWHCAATGGRSMLIVMDAMGYHAANVNATLTPEGRARLHANLLHVALVDAEHHWRHENIHVAWRGGTETLPHTALEIVLSPASHTHLDHRTLHLATVEAGQVGVVHLNPPLKLAAHDVLTLPPGTLPDPTITATMDFVLSEARLFRDRP